MGAEARLWSRGRSQEVEPAVGEAWNGQVRRGWGTKYPPGVQKWGALRECWICALLRGRKEKREGKAT